MPSPRILMPALAPLGGAAWAAACGDGTTEPPAPVPPQPTPVPPRPTTVTVTPATAEPDVAGRCRGSRSDLMPTRQCTRLSTAEGPASSNCAWGDAILREPRSPSLNDPGRRALRHRPARMIRLFGRPVTERRPEPVRHGLDLQRPEQFPYGRAPEWRSAHARKHKPVAATAPSRFLENLQRATTERAAVFPAPLRAWGGEDPDRLAPVDLRPHGPTNLAGASRRQHQKLEGQLHHGPPPRRPHRPDRRRYLAVRQRPQVLRAIRLGSDGTDPVTPVVGPKVHGHGPLHRPRASAGAASSPRPASRARSGPGL